MKKIDWHGEIITLVTPRDNLEEIAHDCEVNGVDYVFTRSINPYGRTIEKVIIRLEPLLSKGITVFFLTSGMGFREVTNQLGAGDGNGWFTFVLMPSEYDALNEYLEKVDDYSQSERTLGHDRENSAANNYLLNKPKPMIIIDKK